MKKRDSVRMLARGALLTALGAALMYVSAVVPSARIALVAIAGVLTVAAVISYGALRALLVFAATALLSLLIVPDKGNVLLYAVFLGYYPIVKSLLERLRSLILSWALKLALLSAVFWALWLMARELLLPGLPDFMSAWLIAWLAANAVFVIYDIGLSKLISFYILRLNRHLEGNK